MIPFATEDLPVRAATLIKRATEAMRLLSVTHSADDLGGFGVLAVTVMGKDDVWHIAEWEFLHDGYGGGAWEYISPETLTSVRASL